MGLTAAATAFSFQAVEAQENQALPVIAARVELVHPHVFAGTIHGWHSNRLLKYGGALYACATLPAVEPNRWKETGIFLQRERDGTWTEVGTLPYAPYLMCVGPDGRFWVLGSTSFANVHINRMRTPLDFGSLEELHTGTNSYMGAGIGPEGNLLVLYAQTMEERAYHPNGVIAAFYDQERSRWYLSRLVTPEGRYGYEGVIVRGRQGMAVLNSTVFDPEHAQGGKYSWRHVRLARCEDLTKGFWLKHVTRLNADNGPRWTDLPETEWLNVGWLLPKDGRTGLQDFMLAPDGYVYLSYNHVSAQSDEAMRKLTETPHYVARIHEDLAVDYYPTGLGASATRLIVDSNGTWYILGRPPSGGDLHLWEISPKHGFKPSKEYVLNGTGKLEAYVIHVLCPERFGGERDGDTIHLLSTRVVKDAGGNDLGYAEMWHAAFDLPGTK
jgi:hypothetical protein